LEDWAAIVEDYWNVVVQDISEVKVAASCPAYTAQSGYLISFLRHRPDVVVAWERIKRSNKRRERTEAIKENLPTTITLTCLSILTTRDAKLIFDAYTSFALDPCFPNIWSNLNFLIFLIDEKIVKLI
jgi:hypothetical protein